jgi:glucan phosphoethanolaminetransferase (alkaline phosphatase superfamily)
LLPVSFFARAWYQRVLKVVFLLSNVLSSSTSSTGEYFKFIGQRSTLSLLDMGVDIPDQMGQLSFHYWYLVVVGGFLILLLYYFLPRRSIMPLNAAAAPTLAARARDFLIMVAVVALAVLGSRGGWQARRLATGLAEVNDNESLGQLALN